MWPYELLGNISTDEPSFVQYIDGGGFPSATQWNDATPLSPTFWSCGFFMNFGAAFIYFFFGKKLIISCTYFLQYSEYLRRKFTFQKWKRWKHNVIFCL